MGSIKHRSGEQDYRFQHAPAIAAGAFFCVLLARVDN